VSGVRKRIALQLTPLLDLLLIVMFIQYMDMKQQAEVVSTEFTQKQTALDEQRRLLDLELAARIRDQDVSLQQQKAELEQQRVEYAERFRSILEQHQQAAKSLAEALKLPGNLMEQIVRLRSSGNAEDARRLEEASRSLTELVSTRGEQLMQMAIRFDEMQKHMSVWEIHLQSNGQALFTDGQQSRTIAFETSEGFLSGIFEASKAFAEPRTLVLIALTYGDTQAGQRRRATDAMPELIRMLRKDSGDIRWYDFSLMGYRPQGGLFFAPTQSLPTRNSPDVRAKGESGSDNINPSSSEGAPQGGQKNSQPDAQATKPDDRTSPGEEKPAAEKQAETEQ
jgi:hypothetical protein